MAFFKINNYFCNKKTQKSRDSDIKKLRYKDSLWLDNLKRKNSKQ